MQKRFGPGAGKGVNLPIRLSNPFPKKKLVSDLVEPETGLDKPVPELL